MLTELKQQSQRGVINNQNKKEREILPGYIGKNKGWEQWQKMIRLKDREWTGNLRITGVPGEK